MIKKFSKYISLCFALLKLRLNKKMIYGFSFWAAFFVDITLFLIQIIVFNSIFFQVDHINGWNRYQMIFFVGTFTLIDGLYMFAYFFGVIAIPGKIRTGKLDLYITKPVSTLFLLTFESIDVGSVLLTIPGFIMLFYSSEKLGISLNIWNVTGYISLIVLMLLLMYDLMIIVRSLSFWFTTVDSLQELEGELVGFSFRIPGIAFKGLTKMIFYIILPYGLIATMPTQFFTEGLNIKTFVMIILVCTFFTIAAKILWRTGLKRYGSASC